MNVIFTKNKSGCALAAISLASLLAACASSTGGSTTASSTGYGTPSTTGTASTTSTTAGAASTARVTLSGAQEVPPVTTSAAGSGSFTVAPDGTIQGKVTTTGVAGTAAHIHEAPAGKNGGVIVPLTKTGDNEWSTAPGAKLTEAQLKAYKEGGLYVNVHSAANPNGEVRAQLAP